MTKANTISLTGYPGSGKDALARTLIERDTEGRWVRLAFADEMKQMFIDLGIPFHRCRREGDEIHLESTEVYAETLTQLEIWKRDDTCNMRECLQRFGMVFRERDPDFWVRLVDTQWRFLRRAGHNVVVTDVRFPNEAEWARSVGRLLGVTRDGAGPVNSHISEKNTTQILSDSHAIVENSGTLEELYEKAQDACEALCWNTDRN